LIVDDAMDLTEDAERVDDDDGAAVGGIESVVVWNDAHLIQLVF